MDYRGRHNISSDFGGHHRYAGANASLRVFHKAFRRSFIRPIGERGIPRHALLAGARYLVHPINNGRDLGPADYRSIRPPNRSEKAYEKDNRQIDTRHGTD